jgi:transcription elongation factor GreA
MNNPPLDHTPPNTVLHLTKEGLDKLKSRLDQLTHERHATYQRLRATSSPEELNSFISVDAVQKLELADIEVTEITNILQCAQAVIKVKDPTHVAVGTTVTIRNDTNTKVSEYTIVCFIEADPAANRISSESPLGEMLLGKQLHDSVTLTNRKGQSYQYEIIAIK